MAYTKRQIVDIAMDALGLGPEVYTLSPDDVAAGVRRLDAMMATWSAQGLRMGYPVEVGPDDADPSADTGIPASAVEAVALQLAVKMAPSFGKVVAPETRIEATRAKIAIDAVFGQLPPKIGLAAGIPMGAGYRTYNGAGMFSYPPNQPSNRGPRGDEQMP